MDATVLEASVCIDTQDVIAFRTIAGDAASWCYTEIKKHTPHRFWRLSIRCEPVDEDEYHQAHPMKQEA